VPEAEQEYRCGSFSVLQQHARLACHHAPVAAGAVLLMRPCSVL
jgi:hypothetical protein